MLLKKIKLSDITDSQAVYTHSLIQFQAAAAKKYYHFKLKTTYCEVNIIEICARTSCEQQFKLKYIYNHSSNHIIPSLQRSFSIHNFENYKINVRVGIFLFDSLHCAFYIYTLYLILMWEKKINYFELKKKNTNNIKEYYMRRTHYKRNYITINVYRDSIWRFLMRKCRCFILKREKKSSSVVYRANVRWLLGGIQIIIS